MPREYSRPKPRAAILAAAVSTGLLDQTAIGTDAFLLQDTRGTATNARGRGKLRRRCNLHPRLLKRCSVIALERSTPAGQQELEHGR